MNCERVLELLGRQHAAASAEELRDAREHAGACANCRSIREALTLLRAEAAIPPPQPPKGAFERAIRAAVTAPATAERARRGAFWLGLGVGSALAAGLAAAIVAFGPLLDDPNDPNGAETPIVTMALHEVRDVTIGLDSPEALPGADIHVVLSGEIGLQGFEGLRELSWSVDLERGANQLSLPVVALGDGGGQLLVEVRFGQRSKSFLVDVRAARGRPIAIGALILEPARGRNVSKRGRVWEHTG
jgi:hypothetical protein